MKEPLTHPTRNDVSEAERESRDADRSTQTEPISEANGVKPTTREPVSTSRALVAIPKSPAVAVEERQVEKDKETRRQGDKETKDNGSLPPLAPPMPPRPVVAVFCHETPDSELGQYVGKIVQALARRKMDVVLFSRLPFAIEQTGVTVHAVGPTDLSFRDDLLGSVEEYTRLAALAFGRQFPTKGSSQPTALLGHEWSTIPLLLLLREHSRADFHLSLHSLERQRGDLKSDLSQKIAELEESGLQEARGILIHDMALGETIRHWLPECGDRLHVAAQPFPTQRFTGVTDPGAIKRRYQIGPVDPTILFIGNLDEPHGPDILMKSIPAITRNHPQGRFVFVGDGDLLWPLRVYARYLLLEGVVRLIGHLEGQPLDELIQAADVVVAPSRQPTEWWPFQAAWAARRPVVVSHSLGASFLEHEKDAVLVYPHESSVVWGVERLLYDARFRELVGHRGHDKLADRFGWNSVAGQLETLLGIKQPHS